ncbi:TspO/MBR family protein [Streptomyces sp. NPDC014684]|uniref:TspO/MBR family protein n=1 Tax=unclassified Streptomyces TaxID=2593676 RepID=UPI0011672731|nr:MULTISPECIES: TspO/MBR family protein [unclassified Streptomyces]MDI1452569.1 tryptophan-rich sensory protein [Streptomyces sp. ATE26]GEJ98954.1 sensory protein TspO [Streptomyces sp. 1-11]
MNPISERGDRRPGPWLRYGAAAAAVAATAVTGATATDPDSAWYASLRKPSWQPPPWAFGVVWTPLYASIAYAAGRALGRARSPRQRAGIVRDLAADLALNAAWTRLFFGRRDPQAALAEIALLNLGNALLIRRIARTDRTAAGVLAPYAAWCVFATALNASIVRLNR